MKRAARWAATMVMIGAAAAQAGEVALSTTRPADHGRALVNPSMGWTMHFYSNIPTNYGSKLDPADTLDDFPGLSTVYLRIPWSFIEPAEGQYQWSILDTPAQRWIAKGKKVAFRITCSENWTPFPTPEWVLKAGAKGTFYQFGKVGLHEALRAEYEKTGRLPENASWDPDFNDPIFMAKLEKFTAALAARYDGNPNVAFFDIGSYGLWGEGHTFMTSCMPPEAADKAIRAHIDMYVKLFPHTLLCISDDVAGHNKPGKHFPETDYALQRGVSLRDDSILVNRPVWYHNEMAQAFWPTLPVILEHEHYGSSVARGVWGDGSLLLEAVEQYHASYMSIHWWPRVELDENRALIDRINRRLGYRLQVRELEWPSTIRVGETFPVRSVWANAGVAPCYPGGFMTLTIKDGVGGIVAVLSDDTLDMRTLPVGPADKIPTVEHQSRLTINKIAPVVRPGEYDLFVSVGQRDGTPRLALPYEGDDGQHRYRVGKIKIEAAK